MLKKCFKLHYVQGQCKIYPSSFLMIKIYHSFLPDKIGLTLKQRLHAWEKKPKKTEPEAAEPEPLPSPHDLRIVESPPTPPLNAPSPESEFNKTTDIIVGLGELYQWELENPLQ